MNETDTNELVVHAWLKGKYLPAGRLRQTGSLFEFWYGNRFLEKGYALDPIKLPLSDNVYVSNGLQGDLGVFGDALPDDWGRYLIKQDFGHMVSDLEMLTLDSSKQRMGALFFSKNLTDKPSKEIHKMEWVTTFSEWLMDKSKPLPTLIRLGSSPGGAKPKCLVRIDDEEWIAKFQPKNEDIDKPSIEYGTLSLARACGIEVPQNKLITLPNNQNVLLVKRFDRNKNGPVHYLSAHTLCGVIKDDNGAVINDTRSYLILADNLSKFSAQANKDKRDLFRRIAFNILIGNHDDHTKNHGVIRSCDNTWKLSPAFDLVAGEGGRDLAMVIGPEYSKPTFSNLLQSTDSFSLGKEEARDIIKVLVEQVSNWKTIFRKAGVSDKTINEIKWAIKDNIDVSKLTTTIDRVGPISSNSP